MTDELYLEHVVQDEEEDDCESDKEDEEDCNAGRSLETHHMKNSPIGEGYKFFCLVTKKGYIINFTLNGRTAAKLQQEEYKEDKKFTLLQSCVI
eukprot:3107325-Ditylum_brightwellii.AAC.1